MISRLSLKILFVSANSVDPDEMLHVCKSTCLGVICIERVKQMVLEYTGTHKRTKSKGQFRS